MKREWIFFILLLVLVGNVSASYHPICNPDNRTDIHGVYIAGAESPGPCYQCGNEDGICPADFNVECEVVDTDCSEIAYWSLNAQGETKITDVSVNLNNGRDLYMVALNLPENVEGKTLSFEVYEQDSGLLDADDFLNENSPITAKVTNGKAIAKYTITADTSTLNGDENAEGVTNELYFKVTGDWEGESDILNVNAGYDVIAVCGDYENENDCKADASQVGVDLGTEWIMYESAYNCHRKENKQECAWSSSGKCLQVFNYTYPAGEDSVGKNKGNCVEMSGSCSYSESKIGDCSVDESFTIVNTLDSTMANAKDCEASFTLGPLPCPATLKLPFFGMYGFVMSALVISLIYIFVLLRKED